MEEEENRNGVRKGGMGAMGWVWWVVGGWGGVGGGRREERVEARRKGGKPQNFRHYRLPPRPASWRRAQKPSADLHPADSDLEDHRHRFRRGPCASAPLVRCRMLRL